MAVAYSTKGRIPIFQIRLFASRGLCSPSHNEAGAQAARVTEPLQGPKALQAGEACATKHSDASNLVQPDTAGIWEATGELTLEVQNTQRLETPRACCLTRH